MTDQSPIRSLLDITFADVDGLALKLDLHLPTGVDCPQLVMWIHGGGWESGDKADCRVKYLAEHGYAVASVNYRLTHQAAFPAQIHDVKAAIRWLRAHATEYGYKADKLVVTGGSAGAHLASLLGTTVGDTQLEGTLGDHLDQSTAVDGVGNFYGPQDFILRAQTQPDKVFPVDSIVHKLLGCRVDENESLAKQASPAWHVDAKTVPFVIFQGDADEQVLPNQQARLMEALDKFNIKYEYFIGEGIGHGDMRFYADPFREPVLKFLAEIYG
jgi:acetyl esterase/lipase